VFSSTGRFSGGAASAPPEVALLAKLLANGPDLSPVMARIFYHQGCPADAAHVFESGLHLLAAFATSFDTIVAAFDSGPILVELI